MSLRRNPWIVIIALLLTACRNALPSQLRRLGYQYEIDAEGDYRVRVPVSEGRLVTVGIGFRTLDNPAEMDICQIWSVASRIPGSYPEGLAENLMRDSWATRGMGAWAAAGRTSDGREVLVYLIRLPAPSRPEVLEAALLDAASSAAGLGGALTVN